MQAVEKAREGFGPDDPHMASACNNLAEFYRLRRQYDKAEPLYTQVGEWTGLGVPGAGGVGVHWSDAIGTSLHSAPRSGVAASP